MISFILCTARHEPLFDLGLGALFAGLALYPTPFEVIVVDDLFDRDATRIDALFDAFDAAITANPSVHCSGLVHVPPKPTPWRGPYRLTKHDYFAVSSARNTGICYARCDYIAFFQDRAAVDPDYVKYHREASENGFALSGTRSSPAGIKKPAKRGPITLAYTNFCQNIGMPLDFALKLNGFNEAFDGAYGFEDHEMGARLVNAKLPAVHEEGCWSYESGHDSLPGMPKQTLPSNEPLLTRAKRNGTTYVENEFDLRAMRDRILMGGNFPTEFKTHTDWRTGDRLEDL